MEHKPDLRAQHADVVLSDGSPIGYFGEGQGALQQYGMYMDGAVYDYSAMAAERPAYIDIEKAVAARVISTLCLIQVDDLTARKFDEYWQFKKAEVRVENPGFSILGENCSTTAARAFRYAGVIDEGIPGLDTPQNLFSQLRFKLGSNFQCVSGYVGFKKENGKMQILVGEVK